MLFKDLLNIFVPTEGVQAENTNPYQSGPWGNGHDGLIQFSLDLWNWIHSTGFYSMLYSR